ncbi:MAG TPA: ABC transporter ATP-binding protein [Candidatus Saccharimonadales bacterium]|nr:ABC transporter ATP-binding protein [Candidatus Saccharimonadales bacterium]
MNALDVVGLEKTYGNKTKALQGIDLEIPEGSFFGLLGPNGAGKSTLIHCIMGLAVPTAGQASVFGHDIITDYQEARAQIGLAPQEINLDWFLTVEETLDFHGGYYRMRKKERQKRIKELLKDFSLTDKRKDRSMFLSGGMKRRVVLARALMHRPKMLILDEPTAGVDVELRLELWKYMKKINEAGTTILLTTHYIEEAEQLCDNIALISKGKIIQTGTAESLKKHYKQKTLEDVYLKVVGRSELTRSSLQTGEIK